MRKIIFFILMFFCFSLTACSDINIDKMGPLEIIKFIDSDVIKRSPLETIEYIDVNFINSDDIFYPWDVNNEMTYSEVVDNVKRMAKKSIGTVIYITDTKISSEKAINEIGLKEGSFINVYGKTPVNEKVPCCLIIVEANDVDSVKQMLNEYGNSFVVDEGIISYSRLENIDNYVIFAMISCEEEDIDNSKENIDKIIDNLLTELKKENPEN